MKKKIINGILIVAALFATSTSFVSCKDNLADEVSNGFDQVASDMNGLQSKIDDLNGKVATLESSVLKNTQDIAALQTELASLQGDLNALKSQVNQNTADIAANKAAIDALNERVSALEEQVNGLLALVNNLVVGATVRATVDPVVGAINMPGYNPLFLAAYAGENETTIELFPIAGGDYNVFGVDWDDKTGENCLTDEDIAVNPVWITHSDNDDWKGLIMGLHGNNAGTLYFTLNPIGLDASQLSFDLVNSLGTVSPIIFSNVRQSSHILTPTLGKRGNEGSDDEEAENPYLYAADAQIPLSANADLAWNKEVSSLLLMEQLQNEISAMIAQVKAAGDKGLESTVTGLASGSYNLMQNFYQAWYKNLTAKQYQNLRVTYNDGNGNERIITSPENIVTAVVSPLSYNMFATLSEVGIPGVDKESLEAAVGKLVKAIQSKLPTIQAPNLNVGITSSSDNKVWIVTATDDSGNAVGTWGYDSTDQKWYAVVDGDLDKTQEVTPAFAAIPVDELFGSGVDLSTIENMIANVLKKYDAIRTADPSDLIARAGNYIEKMSNKLVTMLGGNPFYKAVTPIVLFNTSDGIERLIPEQTIVSAESQIALILTSPTEEYLVPAFKKYVAVKQGSKVVSAKIIDGAEKVIDVELPMGRSEIVYSVVDFRGYTVTKKYPVTRVEK